MDTTLAPSALKPLHVRRLGLIPYVGAWELQKTLVAERIDGTRPDTLLLLEHPPVYTLGRNSLEEHILVSRDELARRGATVVRIERGGEVTYHGPGQLVAYPIVGLAEAFPVAGLPGQGDVLRYVRALEAALCDTCREVGVEAGLRPPYTGAWVGRSKVAAIGVKLSGGVTQHGVALNVTDEPLAWFARVVACGIEDGGVTSLEREGASGLSPFSVSDILAGHLASRLGRGALDADAALQALVAEGMAEALPALS